MLKAELMYNPYTSQLNVRFNGKTPRINSQIEKYKDLPLQNWINKIPYIFHDEMNGYDFELEFSGTKLDFEELKQSFRYAGVDEDQVELFLKNDLDGREEKLKQINELFDWVKQNPCRLVDLDTFDIQRKEFVENPYSCIIIQGETTDLQVFHHISVHAERISQMEELDYTDLTHVPLLFNLNSDVLLNLQKDLRYLQNRNDVRQDQLFFYISEGLEPNKIERVIQDLGIVRPQIIKDINDGNIQKYLALNPITDTIFHVVKQLGEIRDHISGVLKEEGHHKEVSNQKIYSEIQSLENKIERLKHAHDLFVNRDNLDLPSSWQEIQEEMIGKVYAWRKRKTKITNTEEAVRVALEFKQDLSVYFNEFIQDLIRAVDQSRTEMEQAYWEWYQESEEDTDFPFTLPELNMQEIPSLPAITEALLDLKEEKYVMPKDDFFGMLFKSDSKENKKPVLEVTYLYQDWREYAVSIAEPLSKHALNLYFDLLQQEEQTLADTYISRLNKRIEQKNAELDQVTDHLSMEEKMFQEEKEWLQQFSDMLGMIERR